VTGDERERALEEIAAQVRVCTRCRLHEGRTNAVPGEGHPETEVAFVGEGPGFNEDQQGRPFVGAAGRLLTDLLGSIGWRRDEVFITNVVKCRPPGNRDPEPDEIAACAPYLRRQLEVLDPALVVTLGRFSLQTFMPGARISAAHGTVRRADPATGAPDADALALYHPAAAFRQQALRETLAEDVTSLPQALIRSRERRAARPETDAAAEASAEGMAAPVAVAAPASQAGFEVAVLGDPEAAERAAPAVASGPTATVHAGDDTPAEMPAAEPPPPPDDQLSLF
jgi:DNA polymerase